MNIKYITLTIITFTGAIGWGAATHQEACVKPLAGKILSNDETQLLNIARTDQSRDLYDLLRRQQSLDINVTNELGHTPLMIAAAKGNYNMVKALFQFDVNINQSSPKNRGTALMFASHYNRVEAVNLLIDRGANINAADNDGNTALMYAARANNLEIINILLAHGANVSQTNKSNQTALVAANLKGSYDAEALLTKWEADKDSMLSEWQNKKRCEAKRKSEDDDADEREAKRKRPSDRPMTHNAANPKDSYDAEKLLSKREKETDSILSEWRNNKRCEAKRKSEDDDVDEREAKRKRPSDRSMAYYARHIQVTPPAVETVIENLNQQLADDMPYIETLVNEYSFYGFEQCSHNRIRINYNHIFSMGLRYGDVDGFQNVLVGIDGFHHDYLQTMENSGCFEFFYLKTAENGCYNVSILQDEYTIKNITFFPHYWSRIEVIEAILEAYENFQQNNIANIPLINGKYEITGYSNSTDIVIKMIVAANGFLITAYPLLP